MPISFVSSVCINSYIGPATYIRFYRYGSRYRIKSIYIFQGKKNYLTLQPRQRRTTPYSISAARLSEVVIANNQAKDARSEFREATVITKNEGQMYLFLFSLYSLRRVFYVEQREVGLKARATICLEFCGRK